MKKKITFVAYNHNIWRRVKTVGWFQVISCRISLFCGMFNGCAIVEHHRHEKTLVLNFNTYTIVHLILYHKRKIFEARARRGCKRNVGCSENDV
jgi:hypothetical protein